MYLEIGCQKSKEHEYETWDAQFQTSMFKCQLESGTNFKEF